MNILFRSTRPRCRRRRRSALAFFAILSVAVILSSQTTLAEPGARYQKLRAAVVAKFDKDGDGRLDNVEREAARQARKGDALRPQRNPMFQMPPEIVAKYDKDGDEQLNEEESAAANEGIRIRWAEAQKEYDKNGDGNLDDAEREQMGAAIAAGKVEGLPRMFGGTMRGQRGGRGGGRGMFGGGGPPEQSPLAKFDTDKDGRLSADELDAARKAGAGRPPQP